MKNMNLNPAFFISGNATVAPGIANPNYRPFTSIKLKGSFVGHLKYELDRSYKNYDFKDTAKGICFICGKKKTTIGWNPDTTSINEIIFKIKNG